MTIVTAVALSRYIVEYEDQEFIRYIRGGLDRGSARSTGCASRSIGSPPVRTVQRDGHHEQIGKRLNIEVNHRHRSNDLPLVTTLGLSTSMFPVMGVGPCYARCTHGIPSTGCGCLSQSTTGFQMLFAEWLVFGTRGGFLGTLSGVVHRFLVPEKVRQAMSQRLCLEHCALMLASRLYVSFFRCGDASNVGVVYTVPDGRSFVFARFVTVSTSSTNY